MKRTLMLSAILIFIISCTKDEKINNEVLPPSVDLFEAQYHEDTREISLSWRYGSSTDIERFELFYSPGQDSVEKLGPWERSYTLNGVNTNTNYLFNIRVVDLYGTYSEARVVYISTIPEED